jgi:hypothetical protein
MTVQHVHVAEGGQAIVGNVNTPTEGVGAGKNQRNNPMLLDMRQALRCHARSNGAGYSAKRQPFGRLASAGCTVPAVALLEETATP